MKFKYKEWNQGLAEIGQQLNTKFAFANKDEEGNYYNVMPWVKCRDFFGDALEANQTQETKGIYGFKFDPKVQHMTTDKCRLLIKFVNEQSRDAYIKNYNHFKKELRPLTAGIGYGTIYDLSNEDDLVVLVVANPIWIATVANISWFTYVHKALSYPNLDHTQTFFQNMLNHQYDWTDWEGNVQQKNTNERNYMNSAYPNVLTFLKNIRTLSKFKYCHGYSTPVDISQVHNNAGFVAVCKNFYTNIGASLKEFLNEPVAQT